MHQVQVVERKFEDQEDTERAPDADAADAAVATPDTPTDAGAAAASGGEEPPLAPSPGGRSLGGGTIAILAQASQVQPTDCSSLGNFVEMNTEASNNNSPPNQEDEDRPLSVRRTSSSYYSGCDYVGYPHHRN